MKKKLTPILCLLLLLLGGSAVIKAQVSPLPNTAENGEAIVVFITSTGNSFGEGDCNIQAENVVFQQGSSTFNPIGVIISSTDELVASVTVPNNVPSGSYGIAIGEGTSCEVSCDQCFSVVNDSFESISLSPNSGNQDETLAITITGVGTEFTQGSCTAVSFTQGSSTASFLSNPVNIVDDELMQVPVYIPPSISEGVYDVNVCGTTCVGCFTVSESTGNGGAISLNPNVAELNDVLNVTISNTIPFVFGQATCAIDENNVIFSQGSSTLPILSVEIDDFYLPTEVYVEVGVYEASPWGAYDVLVGEDTGCEVMCYGCFNVLPPPEESVVPTVTEGSANQGETLGIMLRSLLPGFEFEQSSCALTALDVVISRGSTVLYVNSFSVNSLQEVILNVEIPVDAELGMYDVKIGEGTDCYAACTECLEVSCIILDPAPIEQMGAEALVCPATADTYVWYLNGEIMPFITQSINVTESGIYHVQYFYEDGCQSPFSEEFNYVWNSVEPSPTLNDLVQMSYQTQEVLVEVAPTLQVNNIILYDIKGQVILQEKGQQASLLLSTVTYPKGLYILSITTDQGTINKKVLMR